MKPIVLLITVFNNASGLAKTLESLVPEQQLLDIVIVDDGSEVAVDTGAFPSLSIHLIRLPQNIGIEKAANAGLEYIYTQNYEFIARIDAGDVALSHRFEKQLNFLRSNPQVGIVGSRINVVNTAGEIVFQTFHPLTDDQIRRAICFNSILHHPTLMIRMDVMRKAGYYDPQFFAAADYDLCWRILSITKAQNLEERLLSYEWNNEHSISNRKRRAQKISALKVQMHHFDKYNIYCYLGILRSLIQIVFFVPRYALRFENMCMRFLFN